MRTALLDVDGHDRLYGWPHRRARVAAGVPGVVCRWDVVVRVDSPLSGAEISDDDLITAPTGRR